MPPVSRLYLHTSPLYLVYISRTSRRDLALQACLTEHAKHLYLPYTSPISQACLTEHAAHREVYTLVGRAHSIAFWDVDPNMATLEHWRAYYPQELFPAEKAWLPAVLEPVRQTYMMLPQPLQLFLPEEALPDDATCFILNTYLLYT